MNLSSDDGGVSPPGVPREAVTEERCEVRATVYDAFRKPEDRRLRRLPRLVASAFGLVRHAEGRGPGRRGAVSSIPGRRSRCRTRATPRSRAVCEEVATGM